MNIKRFEYLKPFIMISRYQEMPKGAGYIARLYYVFVGIYLGKNEWKGRMNAHSIAVAIKDKPKTLKDREEIADEAWRGLVKQVTKDKKFKKYTTLAPFTRIPKEYRNNLKWLIKGVVDAKEE